MSPNLFLLSRDAKTASAWDVLGKSKVSLREGCNINMPKGFRGQVEGLLWKEGLRTLRAETAAVSIHSEYNGKEYALWCADRGTL